MSSPLLAYIGLERLTPGSIAREIMASFVVFLVALPLCMGVAIASGVPPALGLITGVIGGLVVAPLAGCRLQVSGPAAGLTVIIWDIVQTHGLPTLGLIVLAAGLLQIAAGLLRFGQWFRAVSPAVIRGMLAGIGVLIFASQFHVMLDDKPKGNGLQNLITIPQAIYKGIFPLDGSTHHMAALVGLVTIAAIIAWEALRPRRLKMIPGALLGVIAGAALAAALDLPVLLVTVPQSLTESTHLLQLTSLPKLLDGSIILAVVTLAAVASAETMLSVTAVDAMHTGPRANYNVELISQGVGNILCGLLGALPMTGVIVRSSANVDAGATSRLSAFLHGAWLLLFVAALPFVLAYIPTASLAAILVYTGYKLVNPKGILEMWRFDKVKVLIFATTVAAIVATDLLTGILIGVGFSVARLAVRLGRLDAYVEPVPGEPAVTLHLCGAATFITLPRLASTLDSIPEGVEVRVDMTRLGHIDHACMELIQTWRKARAAKGNTLHLGWDEMFNRYQTGHDPSTLRFEPRPEATDPEDDATPAAA